MSSEVNSVKNVNNYHQTMNERQG